MRSFALLFLAMIASAGAFAPALRPRVLHAISAQPKPRNVPDFDPPEAHMADAVKSGEGRVLDKNPVVDEECEIDKKDPACIDYDPV
mmetsp:Transcript_268/g.340  ORF Transcript_268/g.340 Transcript_268/m.340 type:complete len:87 (+) Transcript_268:64-324(+)